MCVFVVVVVVVVFLFFLSVKVFDWRFPSVKLFDCGFALFFCFVGSLLGHSLARYLSQRVAG